MTPAQWMLVERLYHEAATIAIADRGTWLARACGGDEVVRREVESLLAQDASRTGVLDGRAFDQIPRETERESLVGRQLGGYEFLSLIDEGGMGQVYRARDLTLPRDVAVKVVSPEFTHDAVRRARFRKEADVLAGFAHPHIAHIYAFAEAEGRFLLAMELVPGETLAARIARGPLRVSEALDIASQVADALESAHEQGVIHRDLKPANIRITPDGGVKVLDFGLATSVRPALAAERTTVTRTAPGTLLGTVAYMSPEQARGESVDKRTDIWAFGCVLFEMLTGRRLFGSASTAETLALVMTHDIDWNLLPAQVPTAVRALLRRCLERDPRKRLGDVAAIRFALEDVAGPPEHTATTSGDAPNRTRATQVRTIAVTTAVTAAVLIVAAVIGFALWKAEPTPEPSPSRLALSIHPPQGQRFAGFTSGKPILKISPNDSYIAYVATAGGEDARQLYLHSMETDSDEAVPGSVGAHSPFFSPDEEWLGFFSRQNTLMRIPVKGGVAPELVTDVVNPFGATWTEDHRIVLGSFGSVLRVVREEGGVPEVLGRLTADGAQRWPFSLPGGKALLFKVDPGVAAQRIGEADRRSLIPGTGSGILPQYSPSGHVVHAQAGNLIATPFDPAHLQVKGAPTKVMSGVLQAMGVAHFSLSARGSLVYVPGQVQPNGSNLVQVSRSGTIERTFGDLGNYNQPRVAPDGRFVVDRLVADERRPLWQLWLYDLKANELKQFTYKTDGDNRHGTFVGPDQLVVQSDRKNRTRQLFLHQIDGGPAQQLTDFPATEDLDVYSYPVSFCGDALTYVRLVPNAEGWVLHMGDSAGRGRPKRLDFPMAGDGAPSLSPDCRWLAYVSDESGDREVWVRPFSNPGKGQQISKGGGNEPVWNPDPSKREIFYRDGQSLMAARISDQGSLEGKAETLFRDSYVPALFSGSYSRPNYDVFPDGSFLMLKQPEQEQKVTQINVVLNWSEELKRLVPTTK
ncbi:MAG TPA: protein kinase [Vicinamibacterales bacterium]|nr:protein kinase [Vicinamibacterales bacterium]